MRGTNGLEKCLARLPAVEAAANADFDEFDETALNRCFFS